MERPETLYARSDPRGPTTSSASRLDLAGGAVFLDDPGREGVDAGLVAARAAPQQLERPVDVDAEPFGQDSLCLLDRDPRLERALELTRAFEQELGRIAVAAVGGRDDRERAFAEVHLAARQPGSEEPFSDGLEQLDQPGGHLAVRLELDLVAALDVDHVGMEAVESPAE